MCCLWCKIKGLLNLIRRPSSDQIHVLILMVQLILSIINHLRRRLLEWRGLLNWNKLAWIGWSGHERSPAHRVYLLTCLYQSMLRRDYNHPFRLTVTQAPCETLIFYENSPQAVSDQRIARLVLIPQTHEVVVYCSDFVYALCRAPPKLSLRIDHQAILFYHTYFFHWVGSIFTG